MPRAVPLIQAFNAGELSENMAARTDQDKYRGGCKVLLNAIPVAQGPARNRAGSRYVASTKINGKAWLRMPPLTAQYVPPVNTAALAPEAK